MTAPTNDNNRAGDIQLSSGEKFYFKPAAGEHIETTVNLTPDSSAAISGTVFSGKGTRVSGALVLLFRTGEEKKLIDRQFTDDEGHFFFGPIEGDVMYQIKIYKNHVKIRELEIVAE